VYEIADKRDFTGYGLSMVLDSSDNPRLMGLTEYTPYEDNFVPRQYWYDGSSWDAEFLCSGGTENLSLYDDATSIAIDSSGNTHMVYSRAGISGSIRYIRHNGTSWVTEEPVTSNTAMYRFRSALALDDSDHPMIIYRNTAGSFKYGVNFCYWNGSSWDDYALVAPTETKAGSGSVEFHSTTGIHIAYQNGQDIVYGHWNGSGFDEEAVITFPSGYYSKDLYLALSDSGVPHIVYLKYDVANNVSEVFCTWLDGTWQSESVNDDSTKNLFHPSIALDSEGNVGICWWQVDSPRRLYFACNGVASGIEDTVLSGRAADEGVMLRWESIGDELLGFNLYRDEAVTPLNDGLLSATDSRWLDSTVVADEEYEYRLEAIELDGTSHIVGDCVVRVLTAEAALSLSDPYPNPASSALTISYDLAADGAVNLSVYDLYGRLVETLTSGSQTAGRHSVSWDSSASATGVYLIRLEAAGEAITKRAVISR